MTLSSADFRSRCSAALALLREHHNAVAFIGIELEFYLYPAIKADAVQAAFAKSCADARVPLIKWERERGEGQFEFALLHRADALQMADEAEAAKKLLLTAAESCGVNCEFAAKPFADRPGSGLHVHVHLETPEGEKLFYKRDEEISEKLRYAIGGLLATMAENHDIFAPTEASHLRYAKPGVESPATISWGANNRTTALRLPDDGAPFRRIEHRVAGADADIGAVIAVILEGVEKGLDEKIVPPPQIYGNASEDQYGLPKLLGGAA